VAEAVVIQEVVAAAEPDTMAVAVLPVAAVLAGLHILVA
jgi:hypothetical protein